VFRVERSLAERLDSVHVAHFFEVLVIPDFDLLDLVGSAETVEEVEERNSAFNSSKVSHRREVHDLLRVRLCEHCEAGLAAGVNVRVVAENVQSVGRDASCRNVEDARKQFAGDLVHVRDHEEQTLRSGVRRGQRA